jgi:hypothetical protein
MKTKFYWVVLLASSIISKGGVRSTSRVVIKNLAYAK